MAFSTKEMQAVFNEITYAIPGVIYRLLIHPDGSRRFTFVSPAIKEIFQIAAEDLYNDSYLLRSRIHPDDLPPYEKAVFAALEKQSPWDSKLRIVAADGSVKHVQVKALPTKADDGFVAWNGIILDITERKNLEEKIKLLSTRDQLTGLPNRSLLMEQLNIAMHHSRRKPDHRFAVLFIGVDRFSIVNDGLGHGYGDRLLKLVAERISLCLEAGDSIARFGEDKFIVLLHEVSDINDAIREVEGIKQSFDSAFDLDEHEIYLTITTGIVLGSPEHGSAEEILRDAHSAMQRAKLQHRGGYEIFQSEMYSEALQALRLESDLRLAIEKNEFFLNYLPIVSLKTGGIVGVEALIRWRHGKRGLIPPDQFVSVAEETGLISQIGEWVFKTACRDFQSWQNGQANIRLAINLSARQFVQQDIISLLTLVSEYQLDPRILELEITETTAMMHSGQTREILEELRGLGIKIAIDDFGTGYSSLSYLQRLPCNVLKIDKSFVKDINRDKDAATIARTIVAMAHSLGLKVLAEGVETYDQLELLKSFGCDEMQGFYFSRPVSAGEIGAMLQEGKSIRLGKRA